MSTAVRINDSIYKAAKQVAKGEFRSVSNQIEFWASLGKYALENPDLPIEFIKDMMVSQLQGAHLAEPFNFE